MQGEKTESPVVNEYAAAKKEGRQPICPYCGNPLEIRMKEDGIIYWIWDEDMGCFVMQRDSISDIPYCAHCLKEDWNFIDHDFVGF